METIKKSDFRIPNDKQVPKIRTLLKYRILAIFPTIFLIIGILCTTPEDFVVGMKAMVFSDVALVTDYFEVAGIGNALINAALIWYLNMFILYKLDLRPNGIIIGALFMVSGFGLMGKNFFNVWPFYVGGLIYCRYHNINYKNVVLINMLSTSLSPLCNLMVKQEMYDPVVGLVLMALLGMFLGFIIPPISAHIMTAHSGYSLYNMGLTCGLISAIIYPILEGVGYDTAVVSRWYTGDTTLPMVIIISFCIILIVIGYILNGKTFDGYKEIFSHTGRVVTDFIQHIGFGLTMVNMGIMGIIGVIYVIVMGGCFDGPTVTALLTVIGFSAFGKHPKNGIPIMLGVSIASLLINRSINPSLVVMAGLFSTGLAPMAGEFGVIVGVIVGILHLFLVLNTGALHGGFMLYNNGFSVGLIAMVCRPMLDAFRKGED